MQRDDGRGQRYSISSGLVDYTARCFHSMEDEPTNHWMASLGRIRAGFGMDEIPTVNMRPLPSAHDADSRQRQQIFACQLGNGTMGAAAAPPPFPIRSLDDVELEEENRMMDILRILYPDLFSENWMEGGPI